MAALVKGLKDGAAESVRRAPASLYLLPLMLFVVIPALIAEQNDIFISGIPLSSRLSLVALAAYVLALLLITRRLLVRTRIGRIYEDGILFVSNFVLVTGFLFPVARGGMTDASTTGTNVPHLIIGLGLAFTMLVISHTKASEALQILVVSFVVLNIGVIAFNATTDTAIPYGAATASLSQNVFVLSFDGLPGSAVSEVLSQEPELEAALGEFILFENAASSSPATAASILTELSGNRNYKADYDTEAEIWDSSPESLLTNVLGANGYDVTTYGRYGRNSINNHALRVSTMSGQTAYQLLSLSLARSLTRASVPQGRLANFVFDFLSSPTPPANAEEAEVISRISAAQIPQWNRELAVSQIDFERYISELATVDGPPSAHFVHFTHTHFPVQFDRECDYRAHDADWYERNQNRDGTIAITRCALEQFAAFLDKVKDLGIFDESIIILKSDHGEPIEYAAPGTIEATAINGHAEWGYSRYAPLLAIKPRFSEAEGLVKNSAPVLLDDLARTICSEADIAYDCNQYPGYNLLTDEIASNDLVTLFIVESKDSDHTFGTHIPITFTRGTGIVDSLYSVLTSGD